MNGDGDDEAWLTSWEQQCTDSIEQQPDYDGLLITETDTTHRKIWSSFQDSATSIAQLYKGINCILMSYMGVKTLGDIY